MHLALDNNGEGKELIELQLDTNQNDQTDAQSHNKMERKSTAKTCNSRVVSQSNAEKPYFSDSTMFQIIVARLLNQCPVVHRLPNKAHSFCCAPLEFPADFTAKTQAFLRIRSQKYVKSKKVSESAETPFLGHVHWLLG